MNRVMSPVMIPAISLARLRAPLMLLLGGLLLGGAVLPTLERIFVRRGFDEQMHDLVISDAHGTPLASVFTSHHQGDPAYVWASCASVMRNSDSSGPCLTPLDPIISRDDADAQAPRIARVRHLPLSAVKAMIAAASFNSTFSLRAEPSVNVLSVNLRLDHRLS